MNSEPPSIVILSDRTLSEAEGGRASKDPRLYLREMRQRPDNAVCL